MRKSRLQLFVSMAAVAVLCAAVGIGPAASASKTSSHTLNLSNSAPTSWPKNYDPNGSLTAEYAGPPSSLDPAVAGNNALVYLTPVYDRLLNMSNSETIQPMLATSYKFASNGLSMTMDLRQDIKFHDGTPFTSSVVVADINYYKNSPTSRLTAPLAIVTSVDAVSPYVVRFNLAPAAAGLPGLLTQTAGMMVDPSCLSDPATFGSTITNCGTGPYEEADYMVGVGLTYKQAQAPGTFWQTGAGLLKTLTITYVAETTDAIDAVEAGNLDLAYVEASATPQVDSLVNSGQYTNIALPAWALNQDGLEFNTKLAPYNNLDLRLAAEYAVNKQAITGLFDGACTVESQPYDKNFWPYDPALAHLYSYNLAKAKKLVAESGVKDPTMALSTNTPTWGDSVQAIQSDLKAAGIDATIVNLPFGSLVGDDVAGKIGAYYMALYTLADPASLFSTFYNNASAQIAPQYLAQLNPLMAQAGNPTLTQAQRGKIYDKVFTIMMKDALFVPVCSEDNTLLFKNGDLGGIKYLEAPNDEFDYRFLYKPTA